MDTSNLFFPTAREYRSLMDPAQFAGETRQLVNPLGQAYFVFSDGTNWIPSTRCATCTISQMSSLPASEFPLGAELLVTDYPAGKGSEWLVAATTGGVKYWKPRYQIVVAEFSGSAATPLSTVTSMTNATFTPFTLPSSVTLPTNVLTIGRTFEFDYAVRRSTGTTNNTLLTAVVQIGGVSVTAIVFNSANANANGETRTIGTITGASTFTSSTQQIIIVQNPVNTTDYTISGLTSSDKAVTVGMRNDTGADVNNTISLVRFRLTQLN